MRDIPTSPRIKEIRRNQRMRKLRSVILFLILFIFVLWVLVFLSGNKNIVLDKIIITGTHILDQEKIEQEVRKNISGKYIYLFSKANSFIYPRRKIYNNLISDFSRIESLSISQNGLKTLQINIIERVGSYLYCGANIPENKNEVGENCYFINDDGYIFDRAPYFSGNVYFKYYMALEDDIANPLGKQMISVDQFHRIMRFIDKVTSIGFKPIYIVMGQDNTNYLYLSHGANDTIPKIIFKNDADLDILQDNLSISMKKKEFADEINSKYNTLLYIDLRFDNKVLYKFE